MKMIIATMILSLFTACGVFEHKESISISNSKKVVDSDNLINEESNRLAQAKFTAEDFLKFKKIWNIRILGNFQESLLDKANNKVDETYRFFWIPSFDNAVAIRIWRIGDKQFLVVKKVDGEGFEAGKLSYEKSRSLTEEEWLKFIDLLDQTSFWKMTTKDVDEDPVTDGAYYMIEGNKDNQFHEVHRGTGNNGISEVRELGAYLLGLSELKTNYAEY
jgi:hypothetical protein